MKIKFKKKLFNDKEIFITKHHIWILFHFQKSQVKPYPKTSVYKYQYNEVKVFKYKFYIMTYLALTCK